MADTASCARCGRSVSEEDAIAFGETTPDGRWFCDQCLDVDAEQDDW
jgi:hypothetical protein